MWIIIGILLFIAALMTFHIVYGYNMTDDLIEEERQLMLCINWKIENKSCSQIYGGIDGANGEPIK